jgi:alcohol dehydrogenase (NADP+)
MLDDLNDQNMQTLTFNNGDDMPALGLGTWKAKGDEARESVYEAIKMGYRHIDCAFVYKNEQEVGQGIRKAIKEGIVERSQLWITSKLWNNAHEQEEVIPAIERTLHDLQLNYLDLYLIHWPIAFESDVVHPSMDLEYLPLEEVPLSETWHMMEEIKARGLSKHIGVSNFNIPKIKQLMEKGTEKPEMLQIELHPYLQQNELVNWCKDQDIHLTAYSPLGSGDRPASLKRENEPSLLNNETIEEIASKHNAHPAQILIAWSLNRGTAVIPKSTNRDHQKANLDSAKIELDTEDMGKIAELDMGFRFIDGSAFVTEGNPYNLDGIWRE